MTINCDFFLSLPAGKLYWTEDKRGETFDLITVYLILLKMESGWLLQICYSYDSLLWIFFLEKKKNASMQFPCSPSMFPFFFFLSDPH